MFIVTGGAGFIGSSFVWKLNQHGIDDILVVDELGISAKWRNLINRKFSDYLHKDVFLKYIEKNQLPSNVDALIHLGACSSTTGTDVDYFMKNNYKFSQDLAQWTLKNKVRFIYASSAATYGNGDKGFSDDDKVSLSLEPLNIYGYSKQLFDVWVIKNGLQSQFTGLKFFNVFGPNEYHKQDMASVVFKAYHQVKEQGNIKLFKSLHPDYEHGEQKRDFIYIKDCVDMMWKILNNKDVRGIFNVGTGKAQSWNNIACAIFKVLGQDPNIEYLDMPSSVKDQYQYFTQADMSKLKETSVFTNDFSLELAVKDYIKVYLETNQHYL